MAVQRFYQSVRRRDLAIRSGQGGGTGKSSCGERAIGRNKSAYGCGWNEDTTDTWSNARRYDTTVARVRAVGGVAGEAAGAERRDPAKPANGFSDRQAALRALHTRDGRENHRLP